LVSTCPFDLQCREIDYFVKKKIKGRLGFYEGMMVWPGGDQKIGALARFGRVRIDSTFTQQVKQRFLKMRFSPGRI
jgi:hypothetical protein